MVDKKLFNSLLATIKEADTENVTGGKAYSLDAKHILAKAAVTGTFGNIYYATGQDTLDLVKEAAGACEDEFVAKCAVYSRSNGYMKDMPAFLTAHLAAKGSEFFEKAFAGTIDNGRMLRNFVQIIRSGVLGRKSFGNRIRRVIRNWLANRSAYQLFRDSVGNDPSIADIIKMVHPKPNDDETRHLYGYILGKDYDIKKCPEIIQEYEIYKSQKIGSPPNVDFRLLTALDLGKVEWTEIARNAKWQMTRMNINTFHRHGVFEDERMVGQLAERLRTREKIQKAMAFPYQLYVAVKHMSQEVPNMIRDALHDACEVATENIPSFDGKVFIFPDVSGSMSSPVTGHFGGRSSKVSACEAAAVIATAILRKNKNATIIPFAHCLYPNVRIDPRDSIITNAGVINDCRGGGTDMSLPLNAVNAHQGKGDVIVYISDNQSWAEYSGGPRYYGRGTGVAEEWKIFKRRNPKAKMVLIDFFPYPDTQVDHSDPDILYVSGFSDAVFKIMTSWANGTGDFVDVIESQEI